MSWRVANECADRRFGSAARKQIIMFLADKASDDGSGIWCSKGTIQRHTELGESTVKRTISDFLKEGILIETGRRPCKNGFILRRPVHPVVRDHLQAWGAQVAIEGAPVNHIAHKLNEAKLRGRPIPFTDDDMTTIRSFAGGSVESAEEFRILWEAQLAEKTREVDKVLEGLAAKAPEL